MADQFINTSLYGGAITVDLPVTFSDASQIRQVPDNQEVYLDTNGYTSIIVEILEYVRAESDEQALQEHFADLTQDTQDQTTVVGQGRVEVPAMRSYPVLFMVFTQTPSSSLSHSPGRRPRKTPDFTYVHMLLLRLPAYDTDIMITINLPHYPGEYNEQRDEQGMTKLMDEGKSIRENIERTFTVKDWGLFGS